MGCCDLTIPKGPQGWSPVLAVVEDGDRRVLQVTDWTGGEGAKPGFLNYYVGATGFVLAIGDGTDIRGEIGLDGTTGAGTPGADGIDGTNGVDGTNGTDGTDGADGVNGADGTDGVDGSYLYYQANTDVSILVIQAGTEILSQAIGVADAGVWELQSTVTWFNVDNINNRPCNFNFQINGVSIAETLHSFSMKPLNAGAQFGFSASQSWIVNLANSDVVQVLSTCTFSDTHITARNRTLILKKIG